MDESKHVIKYLANQRVIDNLKSYTGKVREMIDLSQLGIKDRLAIWHSDRCSCFDQHICDIPDKGETLCQISAWWFTLTAPICPNHYLLSYKNLMIVKRCDIIPLEIVVRGYITGNTSTSLWTHYNRGIRNYCGVSFPDGLRKNQVLDRPVITPTTKGWDPKTKKSSEGDYPISPQEILDSGCIDSKTYNWIVKKALELFKYGQMVANSVDLILVDTKYEFGFDQYGNPMLIDELHTPDSSRYWIRSSYQSNFDNGLEPVSVDKDKIRKWLRKEGWNPYAHRQKNRPLSSFMQMPVIPTSLITSTTETYLDVKNKFLKHFKAIDLNKMEKRFNELVKVVSKNLNRSDRSILLATYLNYLQPKIVLIVHQEVQVTDQEILAKWRSEGKAIILYRLDPIADLEYFLNIMNHYVNLFLYGRDTIKIVPIELNVSKLCGGSILTEMIEVNYYKKIK